MSLAARPSGAVETIGTDEIKPGMKGYGLTVFQGTKPVKFGVEVVSVVPNFLLRQNIILIRCDHPVTDRAGIIGGMSGSPIFIEGRLAGALAYGWRFSTEPLAGVTPISNMIDVMKRKPRRSLNPTKRGGRTLAALPTRARPAVPRPVSTFFSRFEQDTSSDLLPARTPVTLGGFLPFARGLLEEALKGFGIEPMAGGGGSSDGKGPTRFENGGSIGVQLIRGDMSATGIGTVTLVDGKNVLAFGHPMFNIGESYFPVTTAEIHTVISSLSRSNKLGSPLNVAGSLVQDRDACIVARTDLSTRMIPVAVTVRDPRNQRRDRYSVEIASHQLLAPRFLQAALVNIITHAAADTEDVTAEITGELVLSKGRRVTLSDSGASRRGLSSLAGYFRPVALVNAVLDNGFEDVTIQSLKYDITLRYGLDYAVLQSAYVTAPHPKPGEIINVHLRMLKYNDEEQILSVPVQIPVTAAGKTIKVEVAGGESVSPVMAPPRNLDDALENLNRFYPAESVVVSLNIPGEGIAMHGRILEQLPPSAVSILDPVAGDDQIKRYKTALRKVTPTEYLVDGKVSFKLKVEERRIK